MEIAPRKPLQGVTNIIRFNRHFYIIAVALFCVLTTTIPLVPHLIAVSLTFSLIAMLTGVVLSLAVSFYIYDRSELYKLTWLNRLSINERGAFANINAGFDETSALLTKKYPHAGISAYDFYDPARHTEMSIKRARKAYPPYPGTMAISTAGTSQKINAADHIFLIMAAHEIRNRDERTVFFKSLKTRLKESGSIIVVEHLRNIPNFIAYNIGFMHFFSKQEWKNTFRHAELTVVHEMKITPFICVFILQ